MNPITFREALAQSGLSHAKLAAAAGVQRSLIEKLLSQKCKFGNIAARNALRLADALGVSVRDLMAGEAGREDNDDRQAERIQAEMAAGQPR